MQWKNTVCLIQECLAWSYFRFLKVISHLGEHCLSALVHLTPNSRILPFLSVFFFLQKSQIIFVVDKTLVTSTKILVTLGCFSLERPNNGDSHFHFRFPVPSSPLLVASFFIPLYPVLLWQLIQSESSKMEQTHNLFIVGRRGYGQLVIWWLVISLNLDSKSKS